MHSWQKVLIATTAFVAVTASYSLPAQAMGAWRSSWAHGDHGGKPSGSPGRGPDHGGSLGAPGPIAGAGLPFLLVAGGYALLRRYRSRSKME